MAKVEQKHLEGLTYRTSKVVKGEDGKKKYIPVERALTVGDLLAQSDQGDKFVVVTGNGKKLVIAKAEGTDFKSVPRGGKAGKEE